MIKYKSISKDTYEVLEDLALNLDTEDLDEVIGYLICHWIETDEMAQDMGYLPYVVDIPKDTPKESYKPTFTEETRKRISNGELPF